MSEIVSVARKREIPHLRKYSLRKDIEKIIEIEKENFYHLNCSSNIRWSAQVIKMRIKKVLKSLLDFMNQVEVQEIEDWETINPPIIFYFIPVEEWDKVKEKIEEILKN
ncbi:MAG: hypothetical protein ACKKMV_02405 [Candidatus Nealsonbacteria bacterium]